MSNQPELTTVDEIYYSPDSDSYLYDTASGTRIVTAGNRQYAQIANLVRDWDAETVNAATIYHKPLVRRVMRQAGARVKGEAG